MRGETDAPSATEGQRSARLVVVEGAGRGRKYKVGATAMIGRSVGCEVLIEDDSVSRRHAKLTRRDDGYLIEDQGSANGTMVNGTRVQSTVLHIGDKIRLADKVILVLAEYDQDEEHVLQRQRLETVGRLGAGLAHDFNNMQSVITASLDFVLQLDTTRTLDDARVRDALQDMMMASARASELARNLMTYAGSDREGYTIIDVSKICEEVLRFVQRTLERRIMVVSEITPSLYVIGSSAELHQLLMNLCVNARDALLEGGELRMRVELAESGTIVAMELPPGLQHVLITVTDTGTGMDEATKKRIFEPFFTTKGARAGFGLGLSMVREIIAAHGGTVACDSEPREGTTFRVCLPAAPTAKRRRAVSTPSIPRAPSLPEESLILVADDEEMVRRSMGRILEGAGCRLVYARDGLETVHLYAQQQRRPDLVIMDLDMPKISGEEAVASLLELDPDARILLASAHQSGQREREARSLGAVGFVAKPFNAGVLLTSVLAAINAPLGIDEKTTLGKGDDRE